MGLVCQESSAQPCGHGGRSLAVCFTLVRSRERAQFDGIIYRVNGIALYSTRSGRLSVRRADRHRTCKVTLLDHVVLYGCKPHRGQHHDHEYDRRQVVNVAQRGAQESRWRAACTARPGRQMPLQSRSRWLRSSQLPRRLPVTCSWSAPTRTSDTNTQSQLCGHSGGCSAASLDAARAPTSLSGARDTLYVYKGVLPPDN